MTLQPVSKEFEPKVHVVGSDKTPGKKYFVTNYRPNRFTCDCPDWIYRSHDEKGYSKNHKCKHITLVKEAVDDIFVQTIKLRKEEDNGKSKP